MNVCSLLFDLTGTFSSTVGEYFCSRIREGQRKLRAIFASAKIATFDTPGTSDVRPTVHSCQSGADASVWSSSTSRRAQRVRQGEEHRAKAAPSRKKLAPRYQILTRNTGAGASAATFETSKMRPQDKCSFFRPLRSQHRRLCTNCWCVFVQSCVSRQHSRTLR